MVLAISPKTATIRVATVLDVPAIIDLFCAMRQEGYWKHIPVDNNQAFMGILLTHRILTNSYSHVVVAEDEGQLVGFMGGSLDHHFLYPGIQVLTEWGLYVREEYRGYRVGSDLFQHLEDWAVAHGCRFASRATPQDMEKRGKVFGMEIVRLREIGA